MQELALESVRKWGRGGKGEEVKERMDCEGKEGKEEGRKYFFPF